MSADLFQIERWFRPIALFSLTTMFAAQVVGLSAILSPEVGNFTDRQSWILNPVLVAGAVAALASVVLAVCVASYDESMPPRARARWLLVVLLTNVFGGPLFLVVRWWQQRRHRATPR
jgi:hypothetical protein